MATRNDNTVLCVFGQKGSGKTELSKKIARAYDRVLILDTLGEYSEWAHPVVGLSDTFDSLVKFHERPSFRLAVRLDDIEDYFIVMRLAYEIPDMLLLVEEASFFCSPYNLPPELSQLIRYARHRRISQLYVSRRPAELSRDLTAQSDCIVTFRQHEPRDLAYLAQVAGEDVSRVRTLPAYRCAVFGNLSKLPACVIPQWDRSGEQREMFAREGGEPMRPAGDSKETEEDDEPVEDST